MFNNVLSMQLKSLVNTVPIVYVSISNKEPIHWGKFYTIIDSIGVAKKKILKDDKLCFIIRTTERKDAESIARQIKEVSGTPVLKTLRVTSFMGK